MLSGLTPCPGLFYATPAQDGTLSRIRIPGGIINTIQCQAIADIADNYGGGYVDVTNRANLQIREIHTEIDPAVFAQLQALNLGSHNPSVDQIRNIMTSPTAGIDPQELIDTRFLVKSWDNYITEHPALSGLSAKFSVCFDGSGKVKVSDRPNDITFVAVLITSQVYFHLYVSIGAKGELPVDTGIFLLPEQCLPALAALANVYLAHIDANSQRKPRLREVVNSLSLANYLQAAEKYLSFSLTKRQGDKIPPPLPLPPTPEGAPKPPIGIHPQCQPELFYIGVVLPLGRLESRQLRGLANLAQKYGSSTLRLTPWQNLLVTDIPQRLLTDVQSEIIDLGLDFSSTNIKSGLVACSGNRGCAVAATDTKGDALRLAKYLQSRVTIEHSINIHFSGCDKSCAQHHMSDIALLGVNDGTGEKYHIYVHDSENQEKFGRQLYQNVAVAEVPMLIEKMLNLYKIRRLNSDESFGDFVNKYTIDQLKTSFSLSLPMSDYIRDANEIYRHSFAIIRSEANLDILPADVAKVAVRLIHACGMTDIVTDLGYSPTAAQSGRNALIAGAPILCDCRMVADGVTRRRLPANNPVICTLNEPEVPELAKKLATTRSAAALELWKPQLAGAIVAIGNAPTALFRLLEMLDDGCAKPALILGFPVGFVGAAESKAALAADSRNVPYMTLHGRRGGSAIAAAAVNALATEEE